MFQYLVHKFLTKLILIFWWSVTSPPPLLLFWLLHTHDNLRPALGWLFFLMLLGWLFGGWWLTGMTAYYMFEEGRTFPVAVKHTLYDIRVKLAFVPIIGRFFRSNPDKTKKDDEDH